MPRHPEPYWDAKKGRWRSDCGPVGANGRRRTVYCAEFGAGKKAEARAWFRAYIERRDEAERAAALAADNPSVRQLCEWFLEHSEQENTPRTYEQHRVILGQFCRTPHGDRPMRLFSATDLDGLVRQWQAERRKPSTIRTRIGIIAAAFGWAARPVPGRDPERLLPANPLAGYRKPVLPRTAERYATRAEVAAFLRYCWRHCATTPVKGPIDRGAVLLLRVLAHTGARPIEICSATWGDLDLRKGVITLERWKNSRKTGERRTIFLHRGILRALRRWGRTLARADAKGAPIFASREGPWNTQAIDRRVAAWRRAAIAEGMPLYDSGPRAMNPYMLRHSYISDGLMHGEDIATIAKLCGTSVEQIARTYGHILQDHLAEAAARLAARRRSGRQ